MHLCQRVGLVLGLAAAITGCSDEGGDICPQPTMWLDVVPGSASVEVGDSTAIRAMVCSARESYVIWYVNHVAGGSSEFGTITQTNPATYLAPYRAPVPATVSVMAVLEENQSMAAGCNVTITHTTVYVSVVTGDDEIGTGARARPVKTVTRGVEIAGSGDTVRIARGEYDGVAGEAFPIVLTDGITVTGDDRTGVSLSDSLATLFLITGQDCGIRRLSMTKGEGPAIHVTGSSRSAHIDSVTMPHVGLGVGVLIDGGEETVVRDCLIICGMKCFCGSGVRLIGGDQGTTIAGCDIQGFYWGAYVDSSSNVLIEDCSIWYNRYPVYICQAGDADHDPNPDLGGGARHGRGWNILSDPGSLMNLDKDDPTCSLTNLTDNTIYARNNIWSAYPPVEGTDYCSPNGGQVIW